MAEENDYINEARKIVKQYVDDNFDNVKIPQVKPEDLMVTWSSYILGNWKVVITLPGFKDGLYFEVTHKRENDGSDGPATTYLNVYQKIDNVRIVDEINLKNASIQFHVNPKPNSPGNPYYPPGVRAARDAIRVRSGG